MPELEALRAPIWVKLAGLKDPEKKREYLARAEAAVAREQLRGDTVGPFDRLEQLKAAVLAVAKNTLGARGGRLKPFLPRHSPAFQRLAARIRLLRVVRRELWDRRDTGQPASSLRAMQQLWHRDTEAFPEGTTFQTLGALAGDPSWARRAVAALRARLHSAEEELRRLRSSEMTVAA